MAKVGEMAKVVNIFFEKSGPMVCLESVGKLLFLPLLPVLHNLFISGKSGRSGKSDKNIFEKSSPIV